jgi:hypothetical protein
MILTYLYGEGRGAAADVVGHSTGNMNRNTSIANNLHDETHLMMQTLDAGLAIELPYDERKSCWDEFMAPLPCPDEDTYPTKQLFMATKLYPGAFNLRLHTAGMQAFLIKRHVMAWSTGATGWKGQDVTAHTDTMKATYVALDELTKEWNAFAGKDDVKYASTLTYVEEAVARWLDPHFRHGGRKAKDPAESLHDGIAGSLSDVITVVNRTLHPPAPPAPPPPAPIQPDDNDVPGGGDDDNRSGGGGPSLSDVIGYVPPGVPPPEDTSMTQAEIEQQLVISQEVGTISTYFFYCPHLPLCCICILTSLCVFFL